MEKRITSIEVDNRNKPINSRGENRAIKIHGTQGSGFSLEINDSSGYCILKEPLQNIEVPKSGVYILNQVFPDISTNAVGGLIEETYEVKIMPHADVITSYLSDPSVVKALKSLENIKEDGEIPIDLIPPYIEYSGVDPITLYQYADPTITLTTSRPTEITTTVSGGSDINVKAPAFSTAVVEKTQTLTITETSDGGDIAGFYYVKNNFKNSISKNTSFERVVTTSEEPKKGTYLILKPSTTTSVGSTTGTGLFENVTKGGQDYPISGEIKENMVVQGVLIKEKIVHKSLDVKTCQRATNRFELSDTVGLFPGMVCDVFGLSRFTIESVECGKNITVDEKVIIPKDTKITFTYRTSSAIDKIHTQVNENGDACIEITDPIVIVDKMTLTFDEDNSKVNGSFRFAGSGTSSVSLTNNIKFSNFGKRDVSYTLDLNNIITRTPNARDFNVEVPKNSTNFSITTTDSETDASTKTAAKTSEPRNGVATVSNRTFSYTPNPGFVGNDRILYELSDGTNTSAEKTINITVK